jgi:molybdate transport system substrate-binding protein
MTLSRRLLKQALLVASALSVVIRARVRADELVVSAAASLTHAFRAVRAVGEVVEQQHPGTNLNVRQNIGFGL